MRPVVLTVAGSDCSGGAGIQADIKAIEANGGFAAAVVTAVTAQSTREILASEPVPAELVGAQLEAVLGDLHVVAVKSGMLADGAIVRELARALRRHPVAHYVCDPLLASTGGSPLLEESAVDRLRSALFPLATLLTPNVREAETLTGLEIRDAGDAERAARRLLESGAEAVLLKGGHRADRPACDLLVTPDAMRELPGEWIDPIHTHGTGCLLASAIATGLARGFDLVAAVGAAKRFVTEGIRHGLRPGRGMGTPDPFAAAHGGPRR